MKVFQSVQKVYLQLATSCRDLSYDTACAHVGVVFTQYMILAMENRRESDPLTVG